MTDENGGNNGMNGGDIPEFSLPICVSHFLQQPEEEQPWVTDHDYFEGVLACETARSLSANVRRSLASGMYSVSWTGPSDLFAHPCGDKFVRGAVLKDMLRDLAHKLDEKRERKLAQMPRRPLIEAFLDAMEATDIERRIFRYVLVQATGLGVRTEGQDRSFYELSADQRGAAISIAGLREVLGREENISLADIMELVDKPQSPWVKESLYAKATSPRSNITCMDGNTVRAFMGLHLSLAQFHELPSTLLQETLRKDERFQETETGKALKEHTEIMNKGNKLDETPAPPSFLAEALKTPQENGNAKKDRLVDVLHLAMKKQQEVETEQDDEAKSKEGISESDTLRDEDSGTGTQASENFGPYSSDLDYLEDQVNLMEKEATLNRYKEALKSREEENGDDGYPSGYRRYEFGDIGYDMMRRGANKQDVALKVRKKVERLERDIKLLSERIRTRLTATRRDKKQELRLEQLCEALSLGKFEKYCILTLVQRVIMPGSDGRQGHRGMSNSAEVGELIERYCATLEEKMKCRSFFYKSATLVREGILTLHQTDFMTDLSRCRIELDRRLFDYIVGLDSEMSEIIDGSHLYLPDVDLEDVVLPAEAKKRIKDAALNFDKLKNTVHSLEVDKKYTYGLGQVLLFYGASGTGKTMCANGIAKKLNQKVLLVNFPSFGVNSSGAIIKFIFREARINRALLFFDECESLFMSRARGGKDVNMLLTELERFEGLCILATNRAYDLDEAMHRRISLAIEFKKPDHIMREVIWKTLQPPKLPIEEDVNFSFLAKKFELTGGLIKNAWLQSVSLMIRRDGKKVSQDDLAQAASEQVVGQLSLEDFDRRVVPTCGIESVIVSPPVKESLETIVQYTKAQSVLFGQWGFEKIHRATTGVSALFTGVPGTGKTMAAEAIGFDLGRPLLVVNVAELVSKWVGETGKNIEAVFNDAKKKDAVLVFDEAEGLFGTRSSESSSSAGRHDTMNVGLLLQYIENFAGICIVITNMKKAIDEAFFRRFRFVVEFEMPNASLRESIWKKMLPADCPLASDVSLKDLATRYEMCGGDIKNALLRAATRAALRSKDERILTMDDLTTACSAEVQKRGANQVQGMYS